ncbi:MAG: carbohydrate kinase, YjeF related protein, partial [uncultured bacterium]
MEILSARQIRQLDYETIHQDGVSSLKLMERAGLEFFKIFWRQLKKDQKILIIAGPGNNGGDAFVVARHLAKKKIQFDLLLVRRPDQLKGDAHKAFQKLKSFLKKITLHQWPTKTDLCPDVIIDGLLGTGIEKNPQGEIK